MLNILTNIDSIFRFYLYWILYIYFIYIGFIYWTIVDCVDWIVDISFKPFLYTYMLYDYRIIYNIYVYVLYTFYII